ncbi:endospore germination permease [Paenibacillus sp.]|uniref:GerAB/ArcD/ProY family transporter n=1 Tax=Paenibacillus sp. TaxID=58172 RepID=UPI00281122A4|nr:endospore germination permease [Paenibacillus sp.]
MIDKGKISAFQMAVMMYPTIVATAILIVPGVTAQHAKNDAWLSPILASVVGFATVYIAYRLHQLYPKQTVVQYSERIVGRIAGKAIGLIYIFFYLHTNGIVVREYAEMITSAFLRRTPVIVVISSILLVTAFSVRGGVESIARSALIFTPVFIFPLALILLLIPDLHASYLFPVMEHGIMPAIMGAVVPQAWFSEFFLVSFLLPFLTDIEKGKKWGFISVAAAVFGLVYINLMILLLFGEHVPAMVYPVLITFRYISVADFFENMESVVVAMWVMGNAVKISVFYYAAVLGTAQWLKLSDYKPIVLPIGVLIALFSFWSFPSFQHVVHFLTAVFPFHGTFVQTAIPLILLCIALLRKSVK